MANSSRLRIGRRSISGQIYLVTFVTLNREEHFTNFYAARTVVNTLKRASGVNTLSFVVMPDHVHWLMQLESSVSLSTVVQFVKSITARKLNQRLGRKGAFWQDGFHDYAVRREEDIRGLARYIVANPVRANLVVRIGDYPHWDAIWL